MNRTEFLASIAAAAALKLIPKEVNSAVVTKDDPQARPPKTKIAIERRALYVPGLTVKEIMEIYGKTGIMLYCQHPDMLYPAVSIIEGDAEIIQIDRT